MPTPFTGPAGEHFVLYRLIQKEYIAGLASENAPNSDIIAANALGTKAAAIQVKTRRPLGAYTSWAMKEKHEHLKGQRLFYCFVDLKKDETESPDVYIIPSAVVADILTETHKIWFHQPGRNGTKRNPTEMRRLLQDYSRTLRLTDEQAVKYGKGWMDKYKENWTILDLD